MPQNLPKAALSVFGFWLFVAVAYDWLNGFATLDDFYSNFNITIRFLLFGAVCGALFLVTLRFSKRGVMFGVPLRGLTPSLGTFWTASAPPRSDENLEFPPVIAEWLAAQHAEGGAGALRAALFKALAATIAARPDMPATTVPGGHGGVTLLDHTMAVVVEAMRRAGEYRYRGLLYPDGKVAVAPIDPHYHFSPTDPLVPLVAIGHDLGKLECYAFVDGVWTEVSHAHDSQGSVLLSRVDEFWALSDNERMLVQRAVGYYHHPLDVPINAGDRAFALIGLLNEADDAASRSEHRINMKLSAPSAVSPATPAGAPTEEATRPEPPNADSGDQELFEQRLLEVFTSLIREPERINGTDQNLRIGFKLGEYLYLNEEKVRLILAERLQAPRLATAKMGGMKFVLSAKLAEVLDANAALFRKHGGKDLAPNAALFKMQMTDPQTDRAVTNWPAVFVLFAEKMGLQSLADARFPVTVLEPRWGSRGGESAAKSKPPVPASPHRGNKAARDANTPPPEPPVSEPAEPQDTEETPDPTPPQPPVETPDQPPPQSGKDAAESAPKQAALHARLESAILSRASDGKTLDGIVFLPLGDAAQECGISPDEIIEQQQPLALKGIVLRRGKNDVFWVGAPLADKPGKGKGKG